MAKRTFKVGDTFRPYGIDTTGTILGVSKGRNGVEYTFRYAHNPEASYTATDKELAAIMGVK